MSSFRNFITSPKMVLTTVVWAGAFKVSASHIFDVAVRNGNSREDAMIYPLSIDALILSCALWVATPKGVTKKARAWAALGRYFGFAATIFANLAHSGWDSYESAGFNLIPAIALIVSTEVFVHASKGTVASRAKGATKSAGNVVPMRRTGRP